MGIGLSGMISGLDTDSIVKAMTSGQTTKKDKVSGKIQMNKWTTEAWSDLNKKIYNFYTSFASKLRLKSSYMTRTATSSNENVAKVSASSNAAVGSHTLEVKSLASSQYVTGSKLAGTTAYTSSSKLSAIDSSLVGTTITITAGAGSDKEKEVELKIDENTKISDFTAALKDAGLTASYDATQRRFFIASAESGADNKFTITSSKLTSDASTALSDITGKVDKSQMSNDELTAYNAAIDTISANTDKIAKVTAGASFTYDNATEEEQKLYDAIKLVKDTAVNQQAAKDAKTFVDDKVSDALKNGTDLVLNGNTYSITELTEQAKGKVTKDESFDSYDAYKAVEGNESKTEEEYNTARDEYLEQYNNELAAAVKTELEAAEGYQSDYDTVVSEQTTLYKSNPTAEMTAIGSSIDTALTTMSTAGTETGSLSALGLGEITGAAQSETTNPDGTKSMVVVAAKDSEIILDGATMTGSGNTVSVNGLTIEVVAETSSPITVGVSKDTDSIYNMVKDALKEYNTLLDEMNELYYADSARKYSPLTDEQKEEMSEKDIENWENKIKSALLRRDSSLGSLLTSMRSSLQTTITTSSGNNYSLASFGISTGTYTERGKLHIYGDSDDSTYATYDDRLKKALADNPDDVMEALSGIFGNLYSTMTDKCAKTNLSSALTFYNDKQYKTDLTSYEEQLSTLEDKIADLQDRYYKQFTSMEKSLATLQSQTSSLSSMLGINSNNS